MLSLKSCHLTLLPQITCFPLFNYAKSNKPFELFKADFNTGPNHYRALALSLHRVVIIRPQYAAVRVYSILFGHLMHSCFFFEGVVISAVMKKNPSKALVHF